MKREPSTIGELKEGDVFYFPSDKNRVAYRCLEWDKPYNRSGRKWFRKYKRNSDRSKIIYFGTGNCVVIRIMN